MLRRILILLSLYWAASTGDEFRVTRGEGFAYTRIGNPADSRAIPSGGFFLAGGGHDPEEAFQWLCGKANGGDLLVLRTLAFDDYNFYLRRVCPALNSVATLVVSREGAWKPFVAETIRHASALFLSGGNQADYVSFWQGTPVQLEINSLIARGLPIAGTSAGLHVLSEFVYSGIRGDAKSGEALANPFEERITLTRGFLAIPVLSGTIADAHLDTRDRMGRDIVFLARFTRDDWAPVVSGISIDEDTAVLVEVDGRASVVGSGAAHFLRVSEKPERCEPGQPLTFRNVAVYRIRRGGTFDLWSWTGFGGIAYVINVQNGVLTSTQQDGQVY